jgi:hypothetical protein
MPTINQDSQLDRLRASKIGQRIHGGPDTPSGVQHIVHQHDMLGL